eukprot:3939792-Rhodomonas_salina.1
MAAEPEGVASEVGSRDLRPAARVELVRLFEEGVPAREGVLAHRARGRGLPEAVAVAVGHLGGGHLVGGAREADDRLLALIVGDLGAVAHRVPVPLHVVVLLDLSHRPRRRVELLERAPARRQRCWARRCTAKARRCRANVDTEPPTPTTRQPTATTAANNPNSSPDPP